MHVTVYNSDNETIQQFSTNRDSLLQWTIHIFSRTNERLQFHLKVRGELNHVGRKVFSENYSKDTQVLKSTSSYMIYTGESFKNYRMYTNQKLFWREDICSIGSEIYENFQEI